jgi:hypothetical protein
MKPCRARRSAVAAPRFRHVHAEHVHGNRFFDSVLITVDTGHRGKMLAREVGSWGFLEGGFQPTLASTSISKHKWLKVPANIRVYKIKRTESPSYNNGINTLFRSRYNRVAPQ